MRLLRWSLAFVVTATAVLVANVAPAAAETPTLTCDDHWSYIRAGDNGYLKPDADGRVWADGNRNADYWNLQFLKCRYDTWVLGYYGYLSNRTGHWLVPPDDGSQLSALGTLTSDTDPMPMFRPVWYDANFWSLDVLGMCSPTYVNCPRVWINKSLSPAPALPSWGPLNGGNLLRIES
jgi:hypothetical protein